MKLVEPKAGDFDLIDFEIMPKSCFLLKSNKHGGSKYKHSIIWYKCHDDGGT